MLFNANIARFISKRQKAKGLHTERVLIKQLIVSAAKLGRTSCRLKKVSDDTKNWLGSHGYTVESSTDGYTISWQ